MRAFLVLILFPLRIFSQDLAGIWTGSLQTGDKELPYEIVIIDNGGNLSGYSLTIFNIDGVENVGVKTIQLKNKKGAVVIADDKLIYNNYVIASRRIKLFGELLLQVRDTIMILSGNFRTRALDFKERDKAPVSGIIRLKKLNRPQETKLISTLGEMKLLDKIAFTTPEEEPTSVAIAPKETKPAQSDTAVAAADLATRKTEVIQRVSFKSDSLILRLYDHGVIDGDTVSVVLNGKVIVSRQRLAGKPIVSVVYATPELGDSLLVVMYAESLGTIPPNTGLLTVQDGEERYEVRFEGTKQKSSAILLTRKRK